MGKPFLIVQLRPEDETADSEFAKLLQYGELAPDSVVRWRAESTDLKSVDLDRYAAILVGGSPFDVSLPSDQKSSMQLRVEAGFYALFNDLLERDLPFLGCCSGNGLLGRYLGARISKRYPEAVGATRVALTAAGRQDPLLAGLPDPFTALTGHKEACDDLPAGAVLLATNEHCPVQMFRVRSNIYATQFHPEGDPEGFSVRIDIYKEHGYFPPETAAALKTRVARDYLPHAHEILRRFVSRYRQP